MATITSAGLGSGLDIEGLISSLIAAEGQPTTLRLNNKEVVLQADLSAFGTLKSALSTFQTSVQGLTDLSTFQTHTATSSNTDLFTVSADSSAVAGSFSVQVDQLAQAAKVRSADFTNETILLGAGTLTLGLGASSFSITTDSTTTLAGVRDAINQASDNPGITATIITVDSGSQLVLTSNQTGAANTISIAATDTDALDGNDLNRLATANLTSVQTASDAIIHVDGQQVTKTSNSFSDVIPGVTISLKKSDPLAPGTLNIALDTTSISSKVQGFVNAYNALASTMSSLSSYNTDTKQAAQLFGDSTLQSVKDQLRRALSNPVDGVPGGFSMLAEIGITTDQNGSLVVDSTKLSSVIAANTDTIPQLFASDNGLAKRFDDLLTNDLSSDGLVSSRINGVNKQITDISDQRDKLNIRLINLEAVYRKQFTAMDALVAQLNATGSFLTQQLANLPGFTYNSDN